MPDNSEKKGRDRKRVSEQSHEQAYQRRRQTKNSGREEGAKMNGRRSNGKKS